VHVVQCVLEVLQNHVTFGEINHIAGQFSNELQILWKVPHQQM
jgi:uncharacterized protein (DUF2267 family)